MIDNGRGFPAEDRERLLEPYMTTREKGTGLGLAIVRKIIEEHGGAIELGDPPDGARGARVRVLLPASDPAPDPVPAIGRTEEEGTGEEWHRTS